MQLGTRNLTLDIGGSDYTAQTSKTVITSNKIDSDFVSWADAAKGGLREYRLEFEAVQDLATGTLWDRIWSATGSTVAYLIRPYGNPVASEAQPHYRGNLTITEPEGDFLGGEADESTSARMTVECEWVLTGRPIKVTS